MFQDFPDQRDMAKQPTSAPTGYIPTQHLDGATGLTGNKPDNVACQPPTPHHHPAPQPPCNESKTFCPTENKPGDPDKAYGTFKNTPSAVPGSVAANSAFREDSTGSARGGGAQYGDPLRATAEHNNTAGNWTAMSQTTIILGTDGNTSVQPGTMTGVSQLNEPFSQWRAAGPVKESVLLMDAGCESVCVSCVWINMLHPN